MTNKKSPLSKERLEQIETIQLAATEAVREALRRHMLLGESVTVAGDNGEVKILSPEGIRAALEDLDK